MSDEKWGVRVDFKSIAKRAKAGAQPTWEEMAYMVEALDRLVVAAEGALTRDGHWENCPAGYNSKRECGPTCLRLKTAIAIVRGSHD